MKKLHWLLLGLWLTSPIWIHYLGASLNQIAITANGHAMPFLPPGGDCDLLPKKVHTLLGDVPIAPDPLHACRTAGIHLRWLTDIFISNDGIASIGDWLIDIADMMRVPAMLGFIGVMAKHIFKKN